MEQQFRAGRLTGVLRKPGFWLIGILLAVITAFHYGEIWGQLSFLTDLTASLGLQRHAFERILYLAPIVWAGFLFERRGAFITSLFALALMLPRAIVVSSFLRDSLFEVGAVFLAGNLVGFSFETLRKERQRRVELAVLNQVSSVVSQSLALSWVLRGSINSVREVMKVDAVLVFLVDEKSGELFLAAHQGVSQPFVQGAGRLKVGEGLNGLVAQTGEPVFVEDSFRDPRVTNMAVREENIRSQLIVPLKSKGKVMGTLCVAMRSQRLFRQHEVELLTAIGNQIGVAVENARLYEQTQAAAEQIRQSEERYRELFEGAYDAIWLHDLEDNIIEANKACVALTGYSMEELRKLKALELLSPESGRIVKDVERNLINNEFRGSVSEAKLVRKDGTEIFIQITTTLVTDNGYPRAFQHIARDISQQKRMQENLHFYLSQITNAQEEERRRISRELHDDTIQALVVLSRELDDLASAGKGLSKEKRDHLENLRQQTNAIMEGVRHLSQDLRPAALDRLGLLPALDWLASNVRKRSGITVDFSVSGEERRLPAEVELVLFRIVQEALRNVWRHSQATSAEIAVEFAEGKIRLTVRDNGKGFNLPLLVGDLAREGKLGLAGMQERAQLVGGSVVIDSEPGKGTTVTIEAPVVSLPVGT